MILQNIAFFFNRAIFFLRWWRGLKGGVGFSGRVFSTMEKKDPA